MALSKIKHKMGFFFAQDGLFKQAVVIWISVENTFC